MHIDQLDLFERDLRADIIATKKWMGRIHEKMLRLERNLELLSQVKVQKTKVQDKQLELWGT